MVATTPAEHMSTRNRILAILATAVLVALAVFLLLPGEGGAMLFRPISSAHRGGGGFSSFVRNGIFADPARDFPAALAADRQPFCSATLVGANSMLTAQHCVSLAAQTGGAIAVEVGDRKLTAICGAPSRDVDVALCKLSESIETITFDPIARQVPAVNDTVTLTGWAETVTLFSPSTWLHRLAMRFNVFHLFRYGQGRVEAVGLVLNVQGEMTAGGPVVVEEGDSGGAAYIGTGQFRRIVGVNVCGGSRCLGVDRPNEGTTTLTNLTSEGVARWIGDWANGQKASVCGFTNGKGCRS
jgi:Trypsin